MNRQTWAGILTAIVLAATGAVGAQSSATPSQNPPTSPPGSPSAQSPPPAPTTQTPPAQAPQAGDDHRLSVTGCLREAPKDSPESGNAPAPATDAAGKANAANPQSKFVLENAVPTSTDNATSGPHATAAKTYRLVANDAVLTPHVGKKLELSGTLEDQGTSPRAGPGSPSPSSSSPKLVVQAGKIIADNCTS